MIEQFKLRNIYIECYRLCFFDRAETGWALDCFYYVTAIRGVQSSVLERET